MPIDLFFGVHGLHGRSIEFGYWKERVEKKGAQFVISKINEGKTHEGIQTCGKRLSTEMKQHINNVFKNTAKSDGKGEKIRMSVIAHSLGGLFIRFALKDIAETYSDDEVEFKIVVFLCTPHLGGRRPAGGIQKSIWKTATHGFMRWIGASGIQLMMEDDEMIISKLVEGEYLNALNRFNHHVLFSIAHHDLSVPFGSASIRAQNPYPVDCIGTKSASIIGASGWTFEEMKQLSSICSPVLHHHFSKHAQTKAIIESAIGHKNNEEMYCDFERCVEYPSHVLKNLQKEIPWKRIDLQISLSNFAKIVQPAHLYCLGPFENTPLKSSSKQHSENIIKSFSQFIIYMQFN